MEHRGTPLIDIKCFSCGNFGHLQCYVKGNKIKKFLRRDKLYLTENLIEFRKEYGILDGKDILREVKKMKVKKLSDLAFATAMELDALEDFDKYTKKDNYEKNKRRREQEGSEEGEVLVKRKKKKYWTKKGGRGHHGGGNGGQKKLKNNNRRKKQKPKWRNKNKDRG